MNAAADEQDRQKFIRGHQRRVLRKVMRQIEAEGREHVEFISYDKTPSGLARLVGAEDAYKDAIRIVSVFRDGLS